MSYDFRTAAITMIEEGPELIVRGTYTEMVKVYPKLKSRGFYYEPRDRSWRILLTKLTPLQRKNLVKLIDGGAPVKEAPASHTPSREEAPADFSELKKWTEDRIKSMTPGAIGYQTGEVGFRFGGPLADFFPNKIREVGGNRDQDKYVIFYKDTTSAKLDSMFDLFEKKTKEARALKIQLEALLGSHKDWRNLGVSLSYQEGPLSIKGKTFPIKEDIKNCISGIKFQNSVWYISLFEVKFREVEELAKILDRKEDAAAKAYQNLQQSKQGPRSNRKPDSCYKCHGEVGVGEGWLEARFDHWDEEKVSYVVYHKDEKVCAENKAILEIERAVARTKGEAVQNLRKYCEQPEFFVNEATKFPAGKQIRLDTRSQFVLEPGDDFIWLISYNGSDGDDWRGNNIDGASRGWRAPITLEVRVMLDVAGIKPNDG